MSLVIISMIYHYILFLDFDTYASTVASQVIVWLNYIPVSFTACFIGSVLALHFY